MHSEVVSATETTLASSEDEGLKATSRIDGFNAGVLADLLADLTEDWRGWEGERTAQTTCGDLILSCASDSLGHTYVKVALSSNPYEQDWKAEAMLRIDAAQLDGLAKRLRRFFGSKK